MKEFIYNQVINFYEDAGQKLSKKEIMERIEVYLIALSFSKDCPIEALKSVENDTKILIENLQKKIPSIVDIKLIEPSLRLLYYIYNPSDFQKKHIETATLGKLYDEFKILGYTNKYYDIIYRKDENNQPFLYQDLRHPENVLKDNPDVLPFVMTYCARNAAMHSQKVENPLAHLISMFYTLIELCYKLRNVILDRYMQKDEIYKDYINKITEDYEKKVNDNFKYIPLNMIAYRNESFDEITTDNNEDDMNFELANERFNHLKVIGYAGMGKTTLLENLTYKEACLFKAQKLKVKIPVILDMIRVSDSNLTIESMINTKTHLNSEVLVRRMIEKNRFNIYLDGINEIRIKDKNKRVEYLNYLEGFIKTHRGNKIIVTDRDDNSFSIINEAPTLIITGITKNIIKDFVFGNSSKPEMVWERLQDLNDDLLEACKNPFMFKTLITITELHKKIPDDSSELIETFLKAIVDRERTVKKDEKASDVLRVLIYLVAKESEKDDSFEDNIVLSTFEIFEIFNDYCDKYKRTNRFDNEEMLDLIVKLGILKEVDFEKYTFTEQDYFEFFYTKAIDLDLI